MTGSDTRDTADGSETAVIAAAKAWLDQDPDPETRAELDALISGARAGDPDAMAGLHSRFDCRLDFGTAGLRGELGAGPNRMNRVLVAQAAAGLAAYLLEKGRNPSVVVGYDGRKNSHRFAIDTAELMAGAGVRVILLPRALPTPVLAFAVRHLTASAGVMVTASHNPAADNGYKVYLGGADGGSQIVPPADAEIAGHILKVAAGQSVFELPGAAYETCGEELLDDYVRRAARFGSHPAPVRFVYTAMHGVGWETARRVFAAAGFEEPVIVPEQIAPDAAFPTVAFPNPEEPGALDLAFAKAESVHADLVIANDPDADRLAVAVPGPGGAWRRLGGNEVGALLGWRAARRLHEAGKRGTLAASIVSSPALAAVAAHYGLDHADTLTGFKWISRATGLAYGYEEALGYLVDPETIRDKDGISAATDFLSLVSELKAAGSDLHRHALEFAATFGAFASAQISLRLGDRARITGVLERLRAEPPKAIAAIPVTEVDDFATGRDGFPPSDILRLWLGESARVIVRPSGTEPKLKVYLDAWSREGDAADRIQRAQAIVDALEAGVRPLLDA